MVTRSIEGPGQVQLTTTTATVTVGPKADIAAYLPKISDIAGRASGISRSTNAYDADSLLEANKEYSKLLEEAAAIVPPDQCVESHQKYLCGLHYAAEGYRVCWLGTLSRDADIINLGASLIELAATYTNEAADLITALPRTTKTTTTKAMTTEVTTTEVGAPVKVISSKFFKDDFGWWHLMAEIEYIGAEPAFLTIRWTLYDKDGNIAGTKIWWVGHVEPGQRIIDDRYFTEDYVNEKAVSYKLDYEWHE